ncbi:MAG: hypothetical protein M1833_000914 [Piccolia ochrophora]|nr:MAG: hypothetical protein M1833_000914 [Piccolia ochrophora]
MAANKIVRDSDDDEDEGDDDETGEIVLFSSRLGAARSGDVPVPPDDLAQSRLSQELEGNILEAHRALADATPEWKEDRLSMSTTPSMRHTGGLSVSLQVEVEQPMSDGPAITGKVHPHPEGDRSDVSPIDPSHGSVENDVRIQRDDWPLPESSHSRPCTPPTPKPKQIGRGRKRKPTPSTLPAMASDGNSRTPQGLGPLPLEVEEDDEDVYEPSKHILKRPNQQTSRRKTRSKGNEGLAAGIGKRKRQRKDTNVTEEPFIEGVDHLDGSTTKHEEVDASILVDDHSSTFVSLAIPRGVLSESQKQDYERVSGGTPSPTTSPKNAVKVESKAKIAKASSHQATPMESDDELSSAIEKKKKSSQLVRKRKSKLGKSVKPESGGDTSDGEDVLGKDAQPNHAPPMVATTKGKRSPKRRKKITQEETVAGELHSSPTKRSEVSEPQEMATQAAEHQLHSTVPDMKGIPQSDPSSKNDQPALERNFTVSVADAKCGTVLGSEIIPANGKASQVLTEIQAKGVQRGQHPQTSVKGSGTTSYRVGLSKRARIPSLLRTVKK